MDELTAFDVKALRAADDVAFYHNEDGTGTIRAIKRADHGVPFSEDRTHEIKVRSDFTTYGDEPNRVTPRTAFAMVGAYRHGRRTLVTALDAVRAGDRVILDWEVDAEANGYVKEAGLHADTLILAVERPRTSGPARRMGFHIATQINPGNVARMVRF